MRALLNYIDPFRGQNNRHYYVVGKVAIIVRNESRLVQKITPEVVTRWVSTCYQAIPWQDDFYPSPRPYSVEVETYVGNGLLTVNDLVVSVAIRLHDRLRQGQLKAFERFMVNLGNQVSKLHFEEADWCYSTLEVRVETTKIVLATT